MSARDGGPAYPVEHSGHNRYESTGITIRDYFAAKADVLAYTPLETFKGKHKRCPTVEELAAYIASIRFTEADAMLRARTQDQHSASEVDHG